jgi:hypothetical protein
MWLSLVRAVDEEGRELALPDLLPQLHYFPFESHNGTMFELPLKITRRMETLDLTLALQKTRTVEFLAVPERPTKRAK